MLKERNESTIRLVKISGDDVAGYRLGVEIYLLDLGKLSSCDDVRVHETADVLFAPQQGIPGHLFL